MNKWKWSAIIVGLIILAMWGGCEYGKHSIVKTTVIDTTINVKVYEVTDSFPVPGKNIPGPIQYVKTGADTLWKDSVVYMDLADSLIDALNDFYSTNYYDTTIEQQGNKLRLTEATTQNKIIGRELEIEWRDSVITNTVTIEQPKKAVLSFAFTGGANSLAQPLAGFGFHLKDKKDKSYMLQVQKVFSIKQPFITGTATFPIKLKLW